MAINPSQFGATPVDQNYDVAVQMLAQRPEANRPQETADTPNKLVGYYDPFSDRVELYIVDDTGFRYLKIV